jgi:hypothetical protein
LLLALSVQKLLGSCALAARPAAVKAICAKVVRGQIPSGQSIRVLSASSETFALSVIHRTIHHAEPRSGSLHDAMT